MIDQFFIQRFDPLFLTLDRIGPFQDQLEEIDFVVEDPETKKENQPCNLFMLMSPNGSGKTTVLETLAHLMGLLDHQVDETPGLTLIDYAGFEDIDEGPGRAQWDLLLVVSTQNERKRVIFTLAAGQRAPWSIKSWAPSDLDRFDAESHCILGFERRASGRFQRVIQGDRDLVLDLCARISAAKHEKPLEIQDTSLPVPSMIFFSAYRDILRIDPSNDRPITAPESRLYRPVKIYDRGSGVWIDSPDQLLVWLKWLDANNGTDHLDTMIRIMNDQFFRPAYKGKKLLYGVSAEPPEGRIVTEGQYHRLDRLSSGEKSIFQILFRIPADMTRKTLVLIDEIDVHLHPRWRRLVYHVLEEMARSFPGLTIIFSAHSTEILDILDFEVQEKELFKGGALLGEDL